MAESVVYPINPASNEGRYNQYGVEMSTLGPFQRFITEPGLVGDAKLQREKLGDTLSFIPFVGQKVSQARGDKLGEYLGYLDALGVKAAVSPFLIARQKDLTKTIKQVKSDPVLGSNKGYVNDLETQLRDTNRMIEDEKIAEKGTAYVQKRLDAGDSPLTIASTSAPPVIYHGGPAGLPSLQIPKFNYGSNVDLSRSSGGLYSVVDPLDPRLKQYAYVSPQGLRVGAPPRSAYQIFPDYNKVLDMDAIPKDLLNDLSRQIDDVTAGSLQPGLFSGFNEYDKILNRRVLDNLNMFVNYPQYGIPSLIQEPSVKLFKEAGYDALKFRPRPRMRGEGASVLPLSEDILTDFREVPYEELLREIIRAEELKNIK